MSKIIELDKIYELDLGSAPVKIKTISYYEGGVFCEYLGSYAGRHEYLSWDLFTMNGFSL